MVVCSGLGVRHRPRGWAGLIMMGGDLVLVRLAVVAGAGVKRGLIHGETDEFGYAPVSDRVHVHDIQATILHCLGVDHKRLTYKFQGRHFRLTDVHGELVSKLLG